MIKSINDVNLNGKKVILRVDINSPLVNKKIIFNQRIEETIKTLKILRNTLTKKLQYSKRQRPKIMK